MVHAAIAFLSALESRAGLEGRKRTRANSKNRFQKWISITRRINKKQRGVRYLERGAKRKISYILGENAT